MIIEGGPSQVHRLPTLLASEETSLLRAALEDDASNDATPRVLAPTEERALLSYGAALRDASKTEPTLEPLLLTARRIAQLGSHLRARPDEGVERAVDHIFAAYQDFLPSAKRGLARRVLRDSLCAAGVSVERPEASRGAASARSLAAPREANGVFGDAPLIKRDAAREDLVPAPPFVEIAAHQWALRDMLIDWNAGRHLLLIGNQGVGKNKLADRFLMLLDAEREYVQLHRDTSVQALTAAPSLKDGVVVWDDAPLVRAAIYGRALVVDEADKAPLEVVCVLKALVDDGELELADGRRLVRASSDDDDARLADDLGRSSLEIPIHPNFRLIVLANRPGWPFLGNDFYRECGDVFACRAVANADEASEVQMLRRYGPSVPPRRLVRLTHAFKKLRRWYDDGAISYPYSSRELVKIVQHLDRFPDDGVKAAASSIFDFDAQDPVLHAKLLGALDVVDSEKYDDAPAPAPPPPPDEVPGDGSGDGDRRRYSPDEPDGPDSEKAQAPEGEAGAPAPAPAPVRNQDKTSDGSSGNDKAPKTAPEMKDASFAVAGGAEGPANVAPDDAGAPAPAPAEALEPTPRRAEKRDGPIRTGEPAGGSKAAEAGAALKAGLGADDRRRTLHQMQMTERDARQYEQLYAAVAGQVGTLRAALAGREARERERSWRRLQTQGELDELMLVDAVAGAANVYKRRLPDPEINAAAARLPKRLQFVLDISGSMYTYNRLDGRLTRAVQALVMVLEALDGFEGKYEYSVVGHSGAAPAVRLVPWGAPPATRLERLKLVRKMVEHSKSCKSGDHTLRACERAVADVASRAADEYFVFLLSDADFGRYDLSGRALGAAMTSDQRVSAYALFIASNFEAAEQIREELPPGRGFSCYDTSMLLATLRDIFQASIVPDAGRG